MAEIDALEQRYAALELAQQTLDEANSALQTRFAPQLASLAGTLLAQLTDNRYDAVLLDRKLPDGDGLDLIPQLRRKRASVPVIVLSALSTLDNRVRGLDTGADDYLAKPFSIVELLARLRAVLRRPARVETRTISIGGLEFGPEDLSVRIGGEPVSLPRRELLALELLVRRAGKTVTRHALEEAVYGFDDEIASNSLDAHISRLRRKLADAGIEIHAIRGVGYLLREHDAAA